MMSDSEDDSDRSSVPLVVPVVKVHAPAHDESQAHRTRDVATKLVRQAVPIESSAKSPVPQKKKSGGRKGQGRNSHDAKSQCQFTIGIEEEPKFRVVRRLLGPAGAHVKAIAEQTGAKLRLRGRGSKFLEGPEQEESSDPLMLCLSVPNRNGYESAKKIMWEHLEKIYAEYDDFLVKHRQRPLNLHPQMHEGPREGSR
jgi:hypothetical protein